MSTVSKTQEVIRQARERNALEEAQQKATPTTIPQRAVMNMSEEELEGLKAKAEVQASARPQSANGSLTGKIDIEAMGDVKGDGGDAKNYADNDPAKALGVPVYEHGLNATRDGVPIEQPLMNTPEYENRYGARQSERTRMEMERGSRATENRVAVNRPVEASSPTRTVVTDVDDEDGGEGKAALERIKKEAAAKKAAAKKDGGE